MRIISTKDELLAALKEQKLNPPQTINTSGYRNLGFECGCGDTHGVNDFEVERIASALPVKAIYRCSSHVTKIQIKGFFKQTCITEWTCENSLFEKFSEEFS